MLIASEEILRFIDRLPIAAEMETFETETLLEDENAINNFNCNALPLLISF